LTGVRGSAALWVCLLLTCQPPAAAQPIETKGQLFGWLTTTDGPFAQSPVGLRYIPTFSWERELGGERRLDAELAADGYLAGTWERPAEDDHSELYRAWLRFATPHFELRAGLQKLEFGPAVILRALRWFDRIDPRDPLQLTDGVRGLLGRYYFPDNANLWVWALTDNGRKGLEQFPTAKGRSEFGGRWQHPVAKGELALSTHFRDVDLTAFDPAARTPAAESRLGLDGKWDLGPGFWFEAVLVHQQHPSLVQDYRRFLTLGADQTLPLGNGLHLLAEHLRTTTAASAFGSGQRNDITAISADCHSGLFNSYLAIFSFDWENRDYSAAFRWGRVYDRWSFYLNGFRNPNRAGSADLGGLGDQDRDALGAGKGIQLLIVFNH